MKILCTQIHFEPFWICCKTCFFYDTFIKRLRSFFPLLNASIATWAHLFLHHQLFIDSFEHLVTTTSCPWLPLPLSFSTSEREKRKQQYIHPITYQFTSAQGHSGAPIGSGEMPRLQAAHVNSSSLHFINSIPVSTPARPPPPSLSPRALLALSQALRGPFHQPCYVCNCYILLWFTSHRFSSSMNSHQKEEPTQDELNWGGFCICYLTGNACQLLCLYDVNIWNATLLF